MGDRLRLAMVGCGAISAVHLDAITKGAPRIEITAAIDVDVSRARALADKTGARAFSDLKESLSSDAFDAVDLMLPHHLHEEAAIAAFAAGKHVLLEKPMAPTVDACTRILDAAARSGRVFMVAENAQYWPDVIAARALIDDGAIGEPVTGRASIFFPPIEEYYQGESAWRLDNAVAGGGVAMDTGSHWIRPMRMLLGEIDEVVAAVGRPFAGMEGESLVRALMRFRSGVIGSFDALLTDAPIGPEVFFRITGTAGEITIDGLGKVMLYNRETPRGALAARSGGYFDSYPAEFIDFADAALDGKPLAAGPESALGELRTALAMYRSAKSAAWEKVWESA